MTTARRTVLLALVTAVVALSALPGVAGAAATARPELGPLGGVQVAGAGLEVTPVAGVDLIAPLAGLGVGVEEGPALRCGPPA